MTKSDLYRLVDELPESAVAEAARRLEELLAPLPGGSGDDEPALQEEEAFVEALREELQRHGSIRDPGLRQKLEAKNHPWLWIAEALIGELGPELDSERPHIAAGRSEEMFDEENPLP
jgi:hypothetical protein